MENIRLILLLIGAVIVAGIYVYSRLESGWARRPKSARRLRSHLQREVFSGPEEFAGELEIDAQTDRIGQRPAAPRREPAPADETTVIRARSGNPEPARPAAESKPARPAPAGRIFSLFVMAPSGVPFRGQVLLGALERAGLEYGDMQIFHRYEEIDGRRRHLFSAANIREPGIFDLSAMEHFSTEGIALFMQVTPGTDAVRAFDAMVKSARIMTEELGGTVCDATRSVLTRQTIGHLREEVIGCQLQQRVMKTAS